MPVYEYQCTDCGQIEEALQKISDAPLTTCPNCKGGLKKLISQSAFHLKGSGWYVTDYGGSKNGTDTASSAGKKSDSSASKTASKSSADSKK